MKKVVILFLLFLTFGLSAVDAKTNISSLQKSVRVIDQMINEDLRARGVEAFAPVSDEVFLRRIYLDVIGRIPTYSEALKFLNSENKNKRSELIDELLDSEGYVSHNYNYWADILRIKTKLSGRMSGVPYIDWLKDSLRANKPYDDMVRELITAEGSAWKKGNGATGYYFRDAGMLADNMANTVQIFLGTQLACAQCHDHPFDKWKRKEFYELLAYTGAVSSKTKRKQAIKQTGIKLSHKDLDAYKDLNIEQKKAARKLLSTINQSINGSMVNTIQLPKDYQYDDGKPKQRVQAKTIFGETISLSKNEDPRRAYADWMTSKSNPRFSLLIANRMWKRVMGRGLIEPVDDLRDETQASNPKLMKYLEKEIKGQNFDLKAFLKMLYNTKTYQRESLAIDFNEEDTYYFPGPIRGRMSAEQIWDSVMSISIKDFDNIKGTMNRSYVYENYDKFKNMSGQEFIEMVVSQSKKQLTMRAISKKIKVVAEDYKKALADGDKKKIEELKAKKKDLMAKRNKMRTAYTNKNEDESMKGKSKKKNKESKKEDKKSMSKEERQKAREERKKANANKSFKKNTVTFVRASENTSPAPAGHFLRQLGQSDRELIQGANYQPNVTQVLSFYNGYVDKVLFAPTSQLIVNIKSAVSLKEHLDILFLSLLSRYPTDKERKWIDQYMVDASSKIEDRLKTYADVVWALINTHEFMFSE